MAEEEYLNINNGVITIKDTNYNLTNSEQKMVDFFDKIDYNQYDKKYPHYLKPKLYGNFETSKSNSINRLNIKSVEFSNHYIIEDIKDLLEDLRILPYSIREVRIKIKIEENFENNSIENFDKIFNDFNYIRNIVYNKDKKVYSIVFSAFKKGLK